MNSSDYYSSPYYLPDPFPFSYAPPTTLPDLYYEYGLEASPSSSSSEIISTPPSAQTPLLPFTWDFMEPAYTHTATSHSNPMRPLEMEMTRYECPAIGQGIDPSVAQHHGKGQEILPQTISHTQDSLFITGFALPADTLLGPWAPTPTTFSAPPSPTLHQPRPSRKIPIVDLDELASACEPLHPSSLRGGDSPRSESRSRCAEYQWPKQSAGPLGPISDPFVRRGSISSGESVLLCSCGCMESYRLQ